MLFKFTCTAYRSYKLILYYFTVICLILCYIIPVQLVVLDGNCAVGCGSGTDWMVAVL